MFLQPGDVASHCLPALDLAKIIRAAASNVVAAIPLKPVVLVIRIAAGLLNRAGVRLIWGAA
jgi:hypothetical protein